MTSYAIHETRVKGQPVTLDLRVAICNHSIEPDLMKVWRLQLEHLVDALSVDFVRSRTKFGRGAVGPSKLSVDELLTVAVQQLKGFQVRASRDFNQLGEPISDLCHGQGAQKREIEEGMHGRMICPQAVLVVAVVDRHFDGYRGVYQTNHRRRNTDKVGVPPICRASKPTSGAV